MAAGDGKGTMAAQHHLYDAIVIGAGIQGCFTAYHLAKHKRRVLLLEQVLCPLCIFELRDCPSFLSYRGLSRT